MIPAFPPRKLNPPSIAPRFIPQYRPNVSKPADSSPPPVSASVSTQESAVLPPTKSVESVDKPHIATINNQAPIEGSTQPLLTTAHPLNKVAAPRIGETQPLPAPAAAEVLEEEIDPSLFFGHSSNDGANKRQKVFQPQFAKNNKAKVTKQKVELTSSLIKPDTEDQEKGSNLIQSSKTSTKKSAAIDKSAETATKKIMLPDQVTDPEKSATTKSTGTKRKSSSMLVKKQNTPLFPIAYLQLIRYPIPSQAEDSSAMKIPEKKIITYLKLSPKGIPGIQFSNIDNRAVITAIHPILYGQSPNGKYDLQLHDMIFSLNNLDAKYSSYEQLLGAIHHENQVWDDLPLLTTSSAVDGQQTAGEGQQTTAAASALMGTNTNIYINDMNDPNYHSNRTLLKNAIIESMANIVFVRVRR